MRESGSTHHVIHASSPKVLGVRECIGKKSSLTLIRNKTKIEYINGRQLSLPDLALGIELCLNPHSKMISKAIIDPLNRSLIILSMH